MKRRQLMAVLLTVAMMLAAVGCGGSDGGEADKQSGSSQAESVQESTGESALEETEQEPDEAGNAEAAGSVVLDTSLDHSKPYYRTYEGMEFTTIVDTGSAELPEGQTLESNDQLDYFTQITGARASYAWTAAGDGYKEKLNSCIATGDIPDVMRVSLTQYKQLVKAGLLADLTDAIEEYSSPELKANYAMNDDKALDTLRVGGRIYGIPVTGGSGDGSPLVWIRKDWLEKLNLEEPECIADLEEIATAFMEQDPDGNGQDDTMGIAVQASYTATYGGTGNLGDIFLNVGGAAPGCWVEQEDGKVINGSIMDGAKEALTLLNGWYAKGIIPKDFAVWDGDMITQTVSNNQVGIVLAAWWDVWGCIGNCVNANEEAMWQTYALPQEEGGTFYSQGGGTVAGVYVVNRDFEDPSMFVVINNLMYNTQHGVVTDCSWNYQPWKTGMAPVTLQAAARATDAWVKREITTREEFAEIMLENNGDGHNVAGLYDTAVMYVDPCYQAENPREAAEGDYVSYLGRYVSMMTLYEAEPVYVVTAYEGSTAAGDMYSSFLDTLRDDAYTKMIMGDTGGMSVSDYFDSFVGDWLSQGGEEMIAEVQAELDAR